MSRREMERIIERGEKKRAKGRYIARTHGKSQKTIKTAAGVTATLATVATTATAIAVGSSVAAPPFSTIAAIIPMAIAGGAKGAELIFRRGNKILAQDAKIVNKWAGRFRKRSKNWRKRKTIRTLRRYRRWMKKGKKGVFGRKRASYRRWKRRKAKLEMLLKALYLAEYRHRAPADEARTTRIPKPRQKRAEKKVVQTIRKAQDESISGPPPTAFQQMMAPAPAPPTPPEDSRAIGGLIIVSVGAWWLLKDSPPKSR